MNELNNRTFLDRAIVLLSGGIDSATTLASAIHNGYLCTALSFQYGQRHKTELKAARRVAQSMKIFDHRIIEVNLRKFGKSALTDNYIDVPKNRTTEEMTKSIPDTYVPARNIIFLAYALSLADVIGSRDIFIGVNALDYDGYPDCRPEFIKQFETMANMGMKPNNEFPIRIHTPVISMTKTEIIKQGIELGVDYSLTHSCYDPDYEGRACGSCDSCILRRKGFEEAGVKDPTRYLPQNNERK